MPLSREEEFHLAEYKALRQELATALKDRLEYNRWGLIGLAALYSYIFTNPKLVLFLVPIAFSGMMILHLNGAHKGIDQAGMYIRNIESWIAARIATGGPGGWETYLRRADAEPRPPSGWWPLPLWKWIFVGTIVIATVAAFLRYSPL
jgi:hypothetical protein